MPILPLRPLPVTGNSTLADAWLAALAAPLRAPTGAGPAPISLNLQRGNLRLPAGTDVPTITRAIERAGFGIAKS